MQLSRSVNSRVIQNAITSVISFNIETTIFLQESKNEHRSDSKNDYAVLAIDMENNVSMFSIENFQEISNVAV